MDKVAFVTELTNSLRDRIINYINEGKIPPIWEGHELRWLLADLAEDSTFGRPRRGDGRGLLVRYHDYQDVVLGNNLA